MQVSEQTSWDSLWPSVTVNPGIKMAIAVFTLRQCEQKRKLAVFQRVGAECPNGNRVSRAAVG